MLETPDKQRSSVLLWRCRHCWISSQIAKQTFCHPYLSECIHIYTDEHTGMMEVVRRHQQNRIVTSSWLSPDVVVVSNLEDTMFGRRRINP